MKTKTYIILTPNLEFPARVQAKNISNLYKIMLDEEMVENEEQFNKLVIIEGDFVRNNPFITIS